jgi:hypothetical protein
MIIALPNDHTAGTRPGYPTPRAMVADNDLALGQIVEALSKSRFWGSTVIFITEDDSQNGWDHVSAFRTVGFVLSPYSRLRKTNHTYYAQPSIVRTIEQILGLPPMNIQDAIANLMTDCFSSEKDLAPYKAVQNNIPINEMNPELDKANRVADFIELGELMCKDALNRNESCGGHFREESQEDGEAKRDDSKYSYVAAWEFKGESEWQLHKEELNFEVAKPTQRSYK